MLPPEERPAWLAGLPAEYDLLREPLRRLLEVQAGIQTRPFIDAFTSGIEGLTPPATAIVGDLIGPYRLLQQLGDGGMGSVWLAERADESIKRRVALKLPRMVWARNLETRMARERDILGSLEHPNIARLYDAGVDQLGRPYLALEYVEGERIDAYCDQSKLDVAARIRLFLQVLEAAQYAHVNLVLHRDLKPANVLVNQRGEVRLLDFGIAKLMSDDDNVAAIEQNSKTLARAMTPRYASPEQVQHQRLSLASDVYSLGVMLFELLVGTTPLITQNGSRAEIEIAIIEGNLRTPSRAKITNETAEKRQSSPTKLGRTLRGDLDAILLKALSRNAAERYPSAEMFRADLIRWLEGRPVLAKPPSKLVAIRKFVTRNAVGVSLGTAALVAVLSSATIAVFHAYQAKVESQRATATRDFLIGLFENANPELHGGRDVTARELLISGEARLLTSLQDEPDTAADIAFSIGNAWAQLGEYENQQRLYSQRSEYLAQGTDTSLYFKALIAEAQVATRFGNVNRVSQVLSDISRNDRHLELTAKHTADYLWLKGWLELRRKNFSASEKYFKKSLEVARSSAASEEEISAIYGLLCAQLAAGDRRAATITYQQFIKTADFRSIKTGEKIRRFLEVSGALFEAGMYKLGWEGINKLKQEADYAFGPHSEIQIDLYLLWANWAIRVGRAADALDFLNDSATINIKRAMSGTANEIEWELARCRALLATAQYGKVEGCSQIEISQEKWRSYTYLIDLIKIEAKIKSGRQFEAITALRGDRWQKLTSAEGGDSTELRILRSWYLGVALDSLGLHSDAANELLYAFALSTDRFSEAHPITATIHLAATLSRLESRSSEDEKREYRDALDASLSVLSSSYPSESLIITEGRRLKSEAVRDFTDRNFDVIRNIRIKSPFL